MISGHAITTLVVFIISNFFVICPVSIPTPRSIPRIQLNLTTAPILAIALLWAVQCLDPAVIRNGIVGTEGVKPYNILVFFLSLAYMAITLDITGILQAAAFWVSNRGGLNGWKLYLYFYVMLTLLSILLGNDPIILAGTAFLVYYTSAAQLDPWAWVMAEFAAANTASMVLFAGNPTNIVICEGFNINIAAFTAYTILPFLACNICCFVVLAFQYRKRVPLKLVRVGHRDPRSALLDPVGALVGSLMLGAMLILCLVVSFFGIDVWMISLPFASGKLLFDLTWDHYRYSHGIPMLGQANGLPRATGETFQGPTVVEDQRAKDNSADQRLEDTLPYSPSPEQPQSPLPRVGSVVPSCPETPKFTSADQCQEDTSPYSSSPDKERPDSPLPRAGLVVRPCPETLEFTAADQRPKVTLGCTSFPDEEQPRSPLPHAGSVVRSCPAIPKNQLKIAIPIPLERGTEMSRVSSRHHSCCSSLTDAKRPPSFPLDDEISIGLHPETPQIESKTEPQPYIEMPYVFRWHRSYMGDLHDRLHNHFPTFTTTLPRLPFALIPFAFSQFILIEALNHQGWVEVFADWLVRASGNRLHPTIWLVGVFTVILCNLLGTNIGATILLTKVVRAAALPYDTNRAASIALAVASNIGAISFTFSASLAGLLWRAILQQKGIHVKQWNFAFWNLLPLLVMTSVGLGIVSAEMAVLYRSS
ncbi:hypothetical protein L210DRAFT_3559931 [Boletus edulis BED1]|uniref:Citrate transporter-like domain-containing protein n=1 Tax=Boletus edulis BED1 TaxID=1328754 RepID=A0AAD4G8Z0_BOLED|nr:hypothetical protein L210DRAFT_3559931 [Boletus edulis BED1]